MKREGEERRGRGMGWRNAWEGEVRRERESAGGDQARSGQHRPLDRFRITPSSIPPSFILYLSPVRSTP